MKLKLFFSLSALMCVLGVNANQPLDISVENFSENETTMETVSVAEDEDELDKVPLIEIKGTPISYKVYKPKYDYTYSINFYNSSSTKLEVHYQYANPDCKHGWCDNYPIVPEYGKNTGHAAGPYGKIRIIKVSPPEY